MEVLDFEEDIVVCNNPIRIRNPNWMQSQFDSDLKWLVVPCGKCISCRIQRTREWTERLLSESFSWSSSCFVTLTYDDVYIPYSESGLPTLNKKHLQDYIKRVRRDLEYYQERKIRFYAVGEYGDHTNRPHYHLIIFGLGSKGKDLDLLESKWKYGFVKVGDVTYNSCQYVAGYVQKKLYGKAEEEYVDSLPPFSTMSRNIGKNFIVENSQTFALGGSIPVGNGKRIRRSRYSDKVLGLTTDEKYALSVLANSESDDFWKKRVEPFFIEHEDGYVDFYDEDLLVEWAKADARHQFNHDLEKRNSLRRKKL